MKVTFGLSLDGRLCPSRRDRFDEAVLGRQGLLDQLEIYLGLSAPRVSSARRVAHYLGHLRQHDDRPRFYSDSLRTDGVGTAALLLGWRDEWRLGGWQGESEASSPRRIRELALVETTVVRSLPQGEPERLAAIIEALDRTRTPITSVVLVDSIDELPLLWRKVIKSLGEVSLWRPAPQGRGQLREIQLRAIDAYSNGRLRPMEQGVVDGSVQFVRASTRELAEHWFAATSRTAAADRLLLSEDHGDSLDATIAATGGAPSGFPRPSSLRPPSQAIGLALDLCWAPIDMGRVMEFLVHPIGPFSRSARSRLGRALAKQPGIGGSEWASAKMAIAEHQPNVLEQVAFWLEGPRWRRAEGVPVDALLARLDRLAGSLRAGHASPSPMSGVSAALEQCDAIREGLGECLQLGVDRLSAREIDQLIASATPNGSPNPYASAAVGSAPAEAHAGACLDAFDEVVWWMPSSVRLPASPPWTREERDALAALGVQGRDSVAALNSMTWQWLQPLCAARERFVVVLPPTETEEHPVRQLLALLAPDLLSTAVDLDAKLSAEFVGGLASVLPRRELADAPHPVLLPTPLPIPQQANSFSSLSELFHAPALHVLKRTARLKGALLIEADEGNRLLGNLSHRVIEQLFAQPGSLGWSSNQVMHWFQGIVDDLLIREGATLLMEGAGVSLQRFKAICEKAICRLLAYFQAAGARRVSTEVPLNGFLGSIPLTGIADLIVELADNRHLLVDVKWRAQKRYQEMLKHGEALQLALYAWQSEQTLGYRPAALGYFIIDTAEMLVTAPEVVPGALVVEPPPGAMAMLLSKAQATWRWRIEQWSAGRLDVVPVGGGTAFQGPDGTLPIEGPQTWDQEYLVLLGGWAS